MKIKNVSVKVIGVLGRDLMPDEDMPCNESIVKNPSVETLVKMGFLAVDDSEEKAKALKEAALREARAQIQKEQEEAAAKAFAGDGTGRKLTTDETEAPDDAEAPDASEATPAPKRTRRVTKSAESTAEPAAE